MLPGVAQLARRPAAGVVEAVLVGQYDPAGQRVPQYRGRVRCGEEVDEPVDHDWDQPDGAVVVAALDGVGNLQPQLKRQALKVECVGPIRECRDRPGACGEICQVRAPALAPPPIAAVAQRAGPGAASETRNQAAVFGEDRVVRVDADQVDGELGSHSRGEFI